MFKIREKIDEKFGFKIHEKFKEKFQKIRKFTINDFWPVFVALEDYILSGQKFIKNAKSGQF